MAQPPTVTHMPIARPKYCERQFDLLSTPWAEQLQADRHAMAYLEVYSSIP